MHFKRTQTNINRRIIINTKQRSPITNASTISCILRIWNFNPTNNAIAWNRDKLFEYTVHAQSVSGLDMVKNGSYEIPPMEIISLAHFVSFAIKSGPIIN